MEDTIKFLIK